MSCSSLAFVFSLAMGCYLLRSYAGISRTAV
jgi:hypothetical protein